jgi:hypothetical protein
MDQTTSARPDESRFLFGPQPDGTFHFRRSGISNELYQNIIALNGKLVPPENGRVGYFKMPHATQAQKDAVDEMRESWRAAIAQKMPYTVESERVRYVGAALKRIGGSPLVGPAGELIGYTFKEPELSQNWNGDFSEEMPESDIELLRNHNERFQLAKHVAGIEPNPELCARLGVRTMTDRNAIMVKDELRKDFGTYFDHALKGHVFLPDATLDPSTAQEAFEKGSALVREARARDPHEFDRLLVGLQIAIETGLTAEVFQDEHVASLDDVVALDYGKMEYQDAMRRAKSAYRALVQDDPERAMEFDGRRAMSLDQAINMTMGVQRQEADLDSVINTDRELNRDKSRSTNAAAYAASDELRQIAERFMSNSMTMDGRHTDAERFAETLQGLVDEHDAKIVEVYEVAKRTVSYGPIVARDGDLIAQLVVEKTPKGDVAEVVIHDRASIVNTQITGAERESASIGHALSDKVIDKAIADKTPVLLVAHGGVTFALSAGKLGATNIDQMTQQDQERAFSAAAGYELRSMASRDYHLIKARAESRKALSVPPPFSMPTEPTAIDRARAEMHNAKREEIITANRDKAGALQGSREAIAETAKREAAAIGVTVANVRGSQSSTPVIGEIVAVSDDKQLIVVNELAAKTNNAGYWNRNGSDKWDLGPPKTPRLLIMDVRDHVVPLSGPMLYGNMAGRNAQGESRDATPLTFGVSQGALVTSKLLSPDMQRVVDRGYEYHVSRQPMQQHAQEQAPQIISAELAKFGQSNAPGSFNSEREHAITKLEMDLRLKIAQESGRNVYEKRDALLRTNPNATLKDATTALGITVQRMDTIRQPASFATMGEDGWERQQRELKALADRTGQGVGFEDLYGKGSSFGIVAAQATHISGTVAAFDEGARVMFVHQKQATTSGETRDRLYRVDYPAPVMPVRGGERVDGTARTSPVNVGDTIVITYDGSSTELVPKYEVVNQEIAKAAALERAEVRKEAKVAGRTDEQISAAAVQQMYSAVAARALENTPFAGRAIAKGPLSIDDQAKNVGQVFADKNLGLVVQVAHRGPGSSVEGYRVFNDRDLYARVARIDATGKHPEIGALVEIIMDDNQKPQIVFSMSRDEYRTHEAEFQTQKMLEQQPAMPQTADLDAQELIESTSRRR